MNPVTPTSICTMEPGCITCSDQGIVMRVVALSNEEGFAACVDPAGALTEVQTDLVGTVGEGDGLLVHAGVALAHLGRYKGAQ